MVLGPHPVQLLRPNFWKPQPDSHMVPDLCSISVPEKSLSNWMNPCAILVLVLWTWENDLISFSLSLFFFFFFGREWEERPPRLCSGITSGGLGNHTGCGILNPGQPQCYLSDSENDLISILFSSNSNVWRKVLSSTLPRGSCELIRYWCVLPHTWLVPKWGPCSTARSSSYWAVVVEMPVSHSSVLT